MLTHIKKVLRIPYHRIYESYNNGMSYSKTSKAELKRKLTMPEYIYKIKEIHTDHKGNYTEILINWESKQC